jgi:hypothetical protein
MPAWALKLGTTCLTMVATLAAAGFVSSHPKPVSAPLHPRVVGADPGPRPGKFTITASVRTADVTAVTSTYAS